MPSIPHRKASELFDALSDGEKSTFVRAAGPDGKGPRYHVLQEDEILQITEVFADAADLVKRAGFDAIEIHGGHGYLLASFLSPHSNQRTDRYGGCIENRARFLLGVIRAIRQRVGDEFPVVCRLDAKEYRLDDGIQLADAVAVAKLLVAAGCDAIDVSAYADSSSAIGFTEAPLVHQAGGFIPFAQQIKKSVDVPVIAVGRIEPKIADSAIGRGEFDFVAMGRKLLADPELPTKIMTNDIADIRPCIYCYVCVSNIFLGESLCCAVNPSTGREADMDIIGPAPQLKNVLVIGGGPGGMEAARVSALRGHRVTLWDREDVLGGTARVAALAYEPNGRLISYLKNAVRSQGINVCLGKTASVDSIKRLNPDVVIVATGPKRVAPDIPGKQQRHVFDGEELRGLLFGSDGAQKKLSAFQSFAIAMARVFGITRHIGLLRYLSHFYMPLGKQVCIIGGGLVGLEVAELLAERGRRVTVLEPSQNVGMELSVVRRWRVLHELTKRGVLRIKGAVVDTIERQSVNYSVNGKSESIEVDQVIIAMGAQADNTLCEQLNDSGIAAFAVGDCQQMGYIEGAMLSARKVAMRL